jgi:hypothetical protein
LITLFSPLLLLLHFISIKDPTNPWRGYFLAIVDAAWLLLAMYWNFSAGILQWSPPLLGFRLEWRAGKKVPKVPALVTDLKLSPRKEEEEDGCVVM